MPTREKLHSYAPFVRSFLKPSLIFLTIAILLELFGLMYWNLLPVEVYPNWLLSTLHVLAFFERWNDEYKH